jgi:hypothetical protein
MTGMDFCGKCGTKREALAAFCGECGTQFADLEQQVVQFQVALSEEMLAREVALQEAARVKAESEAALAMAAVVDPCPACGASPDVQAGFCSICGHRLGQSSVQQLVYEHPVSVEKDRTEVALPPQGNGQKADINEAAVVDRPVSEAEPDHATAKPQAEFATSHPAPAPAKALSDAALADQPDPMAFPPPRPALSVTKAAPVPVPTLGNALPAVGLSPTPVIAAQIDEENDEPNVRGRVLISALVAVLLVLAIGAAYWFAGRGTGPEDIRSALAAQLLEQGSANVVIEVDDNMVVYLSGSVASETERREVLRLANGLTGVSDVIDGLEVWPPAQERLNEINEAMVAELNEPNATLAFSAVDGFVLRGTFSSEVAKQRALELLTQRYRVDNLTDLTIASSATASAPLGTGLGDGSGAGSVAAGSNGVRERRGDRQRAGDPQPVVQPTPTVSCLLPSGDESRLPLTDCRSRGGLVQ